MLETLLCKFFEERQAIQSSEITLFSEFQNFFRKLQFFNMALKIGIFIFDEVEVIDYARPFEVFSVAESIFPEQLHKVINHTKFDER